MVFNLRKETSLLKRNRLIEGIDLILNNSDIINQDDKLNLINIIIFKTPDYESILNKDKVFIDGYIRGCLNV
jgi:hypothetical protein